MATNDRLYLVMYDIRDSRRWRMIFKTMHGYGDWLQFSVFQCRLSRMRHAELIADLDRLIHHDDDHILIVDIGLAGQADPKVTSLGKGFEVVSNDTLIV